jgi:hypothetical protein
MRHLLFVFAALAGCGGGTESTALQLPVVAGATRIEPATTDLGYTVTVDRLRVAIRDVEFTIDGEQQPTGVASRIGDWLLGTAHAHPGHAGGGEVIGELIGPLLIEWTDDGSALGSGTLLAGDYTGSNFLFRRAGAVDDLEPGDPIDGHSIHLIGSIERDGDSWSVEMIIDIDEGTPLVGAPFDVSLTEARAPTIALELATIDPFEGDTLFDGVDFADLDTDADGAITIEPGSDTHNVVRRAFARHDHYLVNTRQ